MEKSQFDTDLYGFFANLLDDEEEIELLRKILEGKSEEVILKEYIQNLGEEPDDKN